MTSATEHEQTLNVHLAELLRRRDLDSRAETTMVLPAGEGARRSRGKRVDVLVKIDSAMVAIEAKVGASAATNRKALAAADERIEQGLVECAIAVCYPRDADVFNLDAADISWCVRHASKAEQVWATGNLDHFVSVLRRTPAQLGDPDVLAASLSLSLDAAVQQLDIPMKRTLAKAMDLPPGKRRGNRPPDWDKPAKRSLLVVATAQMFHARLDRHMAEIKPIVDARSDRGGRFTGHWPPTSALDCAGDADPIAAFSDAWNLILASDYKPIFQTGRYALLVGAADHGFQRAIKICANAALRVVRNMAGHRHDLLGRIFHTVLDSARYDGSYYTTTTAATLLATLAIGEDGCDWRSLSALSNFKVTDPACGTGTLLMAAAERIRDLATQANHLTGAHEIYESLIESVLTGLDVNLTATHLAATTLGLLSPTTQFGDMNVGMTLLGVDGKKKAYLGSLEYLDDQPKLVPWPSSEPTAKQAISGEAMTKPENSDLVIMNPPFTRDSLRHDQFSADEEKLLKKREAELLAGYPVDRSSNANGFVVLAETLLKRDSGTLAAVLPLVTATNVSSLAIRKFMAKNFHIETVVTSHDPQRAYFSEKTTIGELLLVARRRSSNVTNADSTRFVNLARNPATPTSAITVANAIAAGGNSLDGTATIQDWPASRVSEGDWGAVQFLSPFLCEQFQQLKSGETFSVISLGEVADIGPDGRAIRDAFKRSKLPSAEGWRALWDHNAETTDGMNASTDTFIQPKKTKESSAQRYWKRRASTMLTLRVRLNTSRVMAVRLETPALGSAWAPIKAADSELAPEEWEKAVVTYLNSSVGVLAMLGNRSSRTLSYPRFAIENLRELKVPVFSPDRTDSVRRLATAYDRHARSTLLPFPHMEHCKTRLALDRAVGETLGLEEDWIQSVRHQLAMEPSITDERYQ